MISHSLAIRLRDAGLEWTPQPHDVFAIPDRDLDDRLFVVADLSTEITEIAGLRTITFNGVVEWSLDWILGEDVVWMPSEAQLRERVGANLVALERISDGYRCTISNGSELRRFDAQEAADAYAGALLELLETT
ncbi:MAG TPA: pilus assembly protein CpaE [Acidimicrobiia bacterium]|nr:pilus assembly protein CpaE [Acidimicrobiia bacterium]